jgi:hypothetical protein
MTEAKGPHGHLLADAEESAQHHDYLMQRHRLDFAKLYLGKEGGYNLRKFKKILKREMEEQPERYVFLNKLKEKKRIIDIVGEKTLSADNNAEIESKIERQTIASTDDIAKKNADGAAEQDLAVKEETPEDPAEESDMEVKKAARIPFDKKLLAMS